MRLSQSLLIWMLLCLAAGVSPAQDWQRKAIELYPQLGVAGSPFNQRFVAAYQERKETTPEFFANPQWPVLLARECAAYPTPANKAEAGAKPAQPEAKPATQTKPAEPPLSPELAAGKELYHAKCARCHDAYEPGPVAEMTWARWLYKWRDRAGLSDDQYGQLMQYGRLAREAFEARRAARAAQTAQTSP